jgi:hypothetical protein
MKRAMVAGLAAMMLMATATAAQDESPPGASALARPGSSPAATRSGVDEDVVTQSTTPWLPPIVDTDPSKRIQWPSPSVVFEADDFRITAGGRTFRGIISPEFVQSSAGLDYRDYDIKWLENGREMRMDISFGSDGSDYWISEWLVYDGRKDPEWVAFKGPLFVTPLDEPMEANVRLSKGKGKGKLDLRVGGMRIHAFHPGSGPAPLTGCTPPVPLDADTIAAERLAAMRATMTDDEWMAYQERFGPRIRRDGQTFEEALRSQFRQQVRISPVIEPPREHAVGSFELGRAKLAGWVEPEHQFKDTGIWTMSPEEVDALLRESGVCHEFSYTFVVQRLGSAAALGQERWCTAPPRGQLVSLEYREDVIRVEVRDDDVQAERQVPPAGWNCPVNA